MGRIESADAIRNKLVAMVARHAGVPVESIHGNTRIWKTFPPSHYEHPAVTAFVREVRAEFSVYRTEEEWENPTPISLSERIRAKRENPALSVADWERDRKAMRGGGYWAIGISLILGLGGLMAPGSWTRRTLVALFFFSTMAVSLFGLGHIEGRRLGPRPPYSLH